jgi:hypothetical protein
VLWVVAWIVAGYAVLVTVASGVGVVLHAPRPRWLDQMAWMLELLAAVLAIGALAGWSQGRHPDSVSTFVGYVAASVLIMPVALTTIREDRDTWSSGVVGVAALATAVIAVRIMMVR